MASAHSTSTRVKPSAPASALVDGDISGEPIDFDLVFLTPPHIGKSTPGRASIPIETDADRTVGIVLRLGDRGVEIERILLARILIAIGSPPRIEGNRCLADIGTVPAGHPMGGNDKRLQSFR